jgi:FkbH-like protein
MMQSGDWITRVVKLADRFGDNGLISVLLARQQDDTLEIDTWLMSCRVLKRGVEQFLLNHLVDTARHRGARALLGQYIPSAKNKLVRDHYRDLGFTLLQNGDGGETRWRLDLHDSWKPLKNYICEDTRP